MKQAFGSSPVQFFPLLRKFSAQVHVTVEKVISPGLAVSCDGNPRRYEKLTAGAQVF